jgi:hypothetical protein
MLCSGNESWNKRELLHPIQGCLALKKPTHVTKQQLIRVSRCKRRATSTPLTLGSVLLTRSDRVCFLQAQHPAIEKRNALNHERDQQQIAVVIRCRACRTRLERLHAAKRTVNLLKRRHTSLRVRVSCNRETQRSQNERDPQQIAVVFRCRTCRTRLERLHAAKRTHRETTAL